MNEFDVMIVGGGPGGYVAAIRGGQLGLKVALIEKDKVGGTCLHRGCIPTKSFLETASLLARARRGQEYGVQIENATLDYPRLLKRTEQIVSQLTRGVEYLLQKNGVSLIRGEGAFTTPKTIAVRTADGERTVSGTNVIIATGSSPRIIRGLEFDGKRVISSDHALSLAQLPSSIVIIGAGAIGMEFASIYNDLGVKVTVVEMLPALMPREDREISGEIGRMYARRGIKTYAGAQAGKLQVGQDGVSLDITHAGKTETLQADMVLVAVGRSANLAGFGIEHTGVAVEQGFVKVDAQQRTNVPGIFAIGDVVGGHLLAHKAMKQGEVAVETIAGRKVEPVESGRVPSATYTRPEVASFGMSEDRHAS